MNEDGRTVLKRQAPMSGDVIGVRVRLEDVRDPNVPLLGLFEVRLDRVCRIDDHGLTRGLVADQVGRAAEIVIDELPKLHEQRAYNLGRTTDASRARGVERSPSAGLRSCPRRSRGSSGPGRGARSPTRP